MTAMERDGLRLQLAELGRDTQNGITTRFASRLEAQASVKVRLSPDSCDANSSRVVAPAYTTCSELSPADADDLVSDDTDARHHNVPLTL